MFSFYHAHCIPFWGRLEFMHVANLAINENWTIQFDMMPLKNGIPLTLTLTNKGGRMYFHGQNWIDIATQLEMQTGK